MLYEGNIHKMRTELTSPVQYILPIGDKQIEMNALIGQEIKINFSGQINCISCGKRTKTSFHQGFCYNCLQTAPEASESVIRPELSKAQFGIARDIISSASVQEDVMIAFRQQTFSSRIAAHRFEKSPLPEKLFVSIARPTSSFSLPSTRGRLNGIFI